MEPQPTLIDVPGILLRTVARLFARLLFIAASIFLLVGTALTLCCLLLGTWRSPRSNRLQAGSNVILSVTALARELRRN